MKTNIELTLELRIYNTQKSSVTVIEEFCIEMKLVPAIELADENASNILRIRQADSDSLGTEKVNGNENFNEKHIGTSLE